MEEKKTRLREYRIVRDGKWISVRLPDMTDEEIIKVHSTSNAMEILRDLMSCAHRVKELEDRWNVTIPTSKS